MNYAVPALVPGCSDQLNPVQCFDGIHVFDHAACCTPGCVTCALSAGFQRCRTNLGSECGALWLGLATEQEQYVS